MAKNMIVRGSDCRWHTFITLAGQHWVDGVSGYTREEGNRLYHKLKITNRRELLTKEDINWAIELCEGYLDKDWEYIDDAGQSVATSRKNALYSANLRILRQLLGTVA